MLLLRKATKKFCNSDMQIDGNGHKYTRTPLFALPSQYVSIKISKRSCDTDLLQLLYTENRHKIIKRCDISKNLHVVDTWFLLKRTTRSYRLFLCRQTIRFFEPCKSESHSNRNTGRAKQNLILSGLFVKYFLSRMIIVF
jgi:hypothetical protein